MLRVGLTGGVACGKSTVAKMFAARGVHLIYADDIARELMRPGHAAYDAVVQHFGREIVGPDGELDRSKLAQLAFSGGRVRELNRLVHPAVIQEENRQISLLAVRDPQGIAMVEAALILEAGGGDRFDKLVVVTCKPEQKAARFAERQKLALDAAKAEVTRRQAAQFSDEKKIAAADYVIDNSGTLAATEQQVERIFAELRTLAGGS